MVRRQIRLKNALLIKVNQTSFPQDYLVFLMWKCTFWSTGVGARRESLEQFANIFGKMEPVPRGASRGASVLWRRSGKYGLGRRCHQAWAIISIKIKDDTSLFAFTEMCILMWRNILRLSVLRTTTHFACWNKADKSLEYQCTHRTCGVTVENIMSSMYSTGISEGTKVLFLLRFALL